MKLQTIYDNLEFETGEVVLPGIQKQVYAIPSGHIVNWPTLPNSGENMEALATYSGDFTLAAGKHWLKVDLRTGDSSIESDSQGERPSRTFLNKGTLVHNGVEEKATAFARQANNEDMVYLVPTMNGKYRVLGSDKWESKTTVKQTPGASVTDKAGTTLEVEVSDVCPSPFYTGKVLLADGELDCSTGVIGAAPAG